MDSLLVLAQDQGSPARECVTAAVTDVSDSDRWCDPWLVSLLCAV